MESVRSNSIIEDMLSEHGSFILADKNTVEKELGLDFIKDMWDFKFLNSSQKHYKNYLIFNFYLTLNFIINYLKQHYIKWNKKNKNQKMSLTLLLNIQTKESFV